MYGTDYFHLCLMGFEDRGGGDLKSLIIVLSYEQACIKRLLFDDSVFIGAAKAVLMTSKWKSSLVHARFSYIIQYQASKVTHIKI